MFFMSALIAGTCRGAQGWCGGGKSMEFWPRSTIFDRFKPIALNLLESRSSRCVSHILTAVTLLKAI